MARHKVLIVGGGFGGVKAALELRENNDFEITLVSEFDDFRYYPTFYHTATGGLKSQSSIPLDEILDNRVHRVKATATLLDRDSKVVTTADGQFFHYDTLILALGSVTNFFGIGGLAEYSYSIKSLEEIKRFKDHLHEQLTNDGKPDLHYVIVGAGPTGIELAGALPAYLRKIMANHGIKSRSIKVELVEAAPRLLPRSHPAVSRAVKRRLRKLGVHIMLKQAVQGLTADSLLIDGKPLASRTVVWTAGVATSPFYKANGFALNDRGKVIVDAQLQAEPDIYVIGDNAATQYGGLAQAALQDADHVAKSLARRLDSLPPEAYKPIAPVSVIPVGPEWAAVEWGSWHFTGKLGWLLRTAADWIGFNDLQPWWKASEQWLTEFGEQEDCLTCSVAGQKAPADILQRTK